MARRYHWHAHAFTSYLQSPHAGVTGENQGLILNLADREAQATRRSIVSLGQEHPDKILPEVRRIIMPRHHEVRSSDVNLKRLGAILTLAHERQLTEFEDLLLLEGAGPRAIQSLALVSEVIYGSPTRFNDPARFSFAHGGKDGHPFPVPLKVYDKTIEVLRTGIEKSKIESSEKLRAIRQLSVVAQRIEKNFQPNQFLDEIIRNERDESHLHGGMTVFGAAKPPSKPRQLPLF
jgi:hypothetical protein